MPNVGCRRFCTLRGTGDVIIHDIEALALVSKLVGTESIANIPCRWSDMYIHLIPYFTGKNIISLGTDPYETPISVDFSSWAKDIVKRFIDYIQYDGTYNKGIEFTINTCLGSQEFKINFFSTHWVLVNPVTNNWVLEGSGTDGGVAMAASGFLRAGLAITGEDLKEYDGVFDDDEYNYGFLHPIDKIPNGIDNEDFTYTYFDDNLTRSLSCVGNILGDGTFYVLRYLRDNHDLFDTEQFPNNEHLPLINLVLHDPDYNVMELEDETYNSDKELYEDLLNSAPEDGPASDCEDIRWTSASRCIWSWKLGRYPNEHIEYNGLDYMMLHNLYYIAFRKEDLKTIIITNVEQDINKRSTSQRAGFIETSSSVLGNDVKYTATRGITLKAGFSAKGEESKTFVAKTEPLPNNYQGGLYTLPSISQSAPSYIRGNNFFDNQTVDNSTEIDELNDILSIKIYPNPTNDYTRIYTQGMNLPTEFNVINTNGTIVYSGLITLNRQTVNLKSLQKGIYFIQFYLNNKIETKKIILI